MAKRSIFTPNSHETQIMLRLFDDGEATNQSLTQAIQTTSATVSARLSELMRNGYVRSRFMPGTGKGAPSAIYSLTADGLEEALILEDTAKRRSAMAEKMKAIQ